MNDGGAAFPSPGVVVIERTDGREHARQQGAYEGMSLRDYFAAKAIQAAVGNSGTKDLWTIGERATWAYAQADSHAQSEANTMNDESETPWDEMDLRDYFAARALTECIQVANAQIPPGMVAEEKLSVLFTKAAVYAYYAADAMLEARKLP
jgi:hypothetical protein